MPNRLSKLGIFTALALLLSTPAFAADGAKVNELVIAAPIPDAQRDATIHAARAFYDFWNTGDDALLKQAIAPTFADRTLPPGRPQGPRRACLRFAPVPRRRARPHCDRREDDCRRRLCHRAHALCRTLHRHVR